jgi:hypothetical protein
MSDTLVRVRRDSDLLTLHCRCGATWRAVLVRDSGHARAAHKPKARHCRPGEAVEITFLSTFEVLRNGEWFPFDPEF